MSQVPGAPPKLAIPKLDNTAGALVIAVFISCGLYGVTFLQTVFYYMNFSDNDGWDLKTLVGVLWGLDTAHLALACHAVYWYLVTNYAKPQFLDIVSWSLLGDVFLTNGIAVLVQMYMIKRIYILSKGNAILSGFLVVISLLSFSSGFAYGVRLAQLGRSSLIPTIQYLIKTSLASTLSVDVLITASLIFYLHRSRTGIKSTDSIISFLIIFAVNTGALTSLFALGDVIFHAVMPKTLAFMVFYVQLSKLYVNSFLGILNARQITRDRKQAAHTFSQSQTQTRTLGQSTNNHIDFKSANMTYGTVTETNVPLEDMKDRHEVV